MSVQGRLTVGESDDSRFEVGEQYDVRIYADRTAEIGTAQAAPSSEVPLELPPYGETDFVHRDEVAPESSGAASSGQP